MLPTFFLAAASALGILASRLFHFSVCVWWIFAGASVIFFAVRSLRGWPVVFAFFFLAALRYQAVNQKLLQDPFQDWNHRKIFLLVRTGEAGDPLRTLAAVQAAFLEHHFYRVKTNLLLLANRPIPENRNLWVAGKLEALPQKPGFYQEEGCRHEFYLSKIVRMEKPDGCLVGLRSKIRASLADAFERDLTPENRALAEAIFLGNHGGISPGDLERFRATGTYHILVASGLKVGFVVGCVWLLSWTFPFSARLLACSFTALLYAWLVGLQAPVLRAVLMIFCGFLGLLLGRGKDSRSGILLAFLLLLFWNPLFLFDAGFQLSFLAVFGILLFFERIAAVFGFLPKWIAASLGISLSAQSLILVPLAYYFHTVSLVSPVANLPVVPLSTASLVFGSVELLAGRFSDTVARLIAYGHNVILSCIFWLARHLGSLPHASYWVASPRMATVIFSYLLLVGISLWMSGEKVGKWTALLGGSALLLLWARSFFIPPPASVTFLKVGQGECAVVRTAGKTFLVNGGGSFRDFSSSGRSVGEKILVPYLHQEGVNRIEGILLTSSRLDHVGALPAVLEHFPVKQIWLRKEELWTSGTVHVGTVPEVHNSFALGKFLWLARMKKIPIVFLRRREILHLPGRIYFVCNRKRILLMVPSGAIFPKLKAVGIKVYPSPGAVRIEFYS